MEPIIAALLLFSAPPDPCEAARAEYESLSLESALEKAEIAFNATPERPLACLEIKALTLMVLGRLDDARATLADLFQRDVEYLVADRSLSPSQRQEIESVRESVRPMTVMVKPRWLVHELLRLDLQVSGGLRDAVALEYQLNLAPAFVKKTGVANLVGRVATATTAISARTEVATVAMTGRVINLAGRSLQNFQADLILPPRPPPPERVAGDEGGVPWFVWVGIGATLIGATVAIALLAQPSPPDGAGTLGTKDVDP